LWLTANYLIADIGGMRRSGLFIPIFVATMFLAKILIVNQILTLSEVVGACFAYIIWISVLRPTGAPAWVAAAALCSAIIVLRLEPFNFQLSATPFGWLPFRSYLSGSLDINIQSFFEKTFLYGSLLWLGAKMGLRHWKATALVSCLLFATSIAESYLPGRSAEITDAVMAAMIGIIFAAMSSIAGGGETNAKAVARTSSVIA
jgi:hypothetical protein